MNEEEELPRQQLRAVGESKRDAVRERECAEVERADTGVFQFQKFQFPAGNAAEHGRIVHHFSDGERGQILRRIENRFGQPAPVRAVADARPSRRRANRHTRRP